MMKEISIDDFINLHFRCVVSDVMGAAVLLLEGDSDEHGGIAMPSWESEGKRQCWTLPSAPTIITPDYVSTAHSVE